MEPKASPGIKKAKLPRWLTAVQNSGAGRFRSNKNGFFSFLIFFSCSLTTRSTFSSLYPLYSDLTGAPEGAPPMKYTGGGVQKISDPPPIASVWGKAGAGAPKLVLAFGPRRLRAASSYARAASSAVSKVPSHFRVFFHGSRISAANRPHGLLRTPLKCASLAPPPLTWAECLGWAGGWRGGGDGGSTARESEVFRRCSASTAIGGVVRVDCTDREIGEEWEFRVRVLEVIYSGGDSLG